MAKTTTLTSAYPHLTTVMYEINVLKEYRKTVPPVIANQVGYREQVVKPGPALLQVDVSNGFRGVTTIIRQGNSAIPIGRQPGEVVEFVFTLPKDIVETDIVDLKECNDVVSARHEVITLKKAIKVMASALKSALPGVRLMVDDKASERIWNEASK